MSAPQVTLELPAELYAQLKELATEASTEPVQVIEQLVGAAHQHRAWQRDVAALRAQIQADGGLAIGSSTEDIANQLRHTRRELFDAEYAHLYR